MNEEESRRVDEAYKDFVTWRGSLIEALITDGKSFHKVVDEDRFHGKFKHWQVNWPDDLLPGLPPEVMRPNFTCYIVSEICWLVAFSTHIDGWITSVVLNSQGLGKNGRCQILDDNCPIRVLSLMEKNRQSLFKKINDLPRIYDIVCKVAEMKLRGPDVPVQDDDEDYAVCEKCGEYASCMYWTWCDTCEEDTILCCPEEECRLCGNKFAITAERNL